MMKVSQAVGHVSNKMMECLLITRAFMGILVLIASLWRGTAYSQDLTVSQQKALPSLPALTVPDDFREQALQSTVASCLEPAPLPGLDDYVGPMKKTVGLFARALERTSVYQLPKSL